MSMMMDNFDDLLKEELDQVKSESLKLKIVALKNLFENRIKEEIDFIEKKNELSKKYENKYIPFYEKRTRVIEGENEVNFQEISEEALKIHVNNECPNEEKGIPGFWMKAISNCFIYMDILNENDKEILFYLKDIRVVYLEKNNFSINFYFNKNKYFDHEVLTKTCIHSEKNPKEIELINGTNIEWKSKDLNPCIKEKFMKKSSAKKKDDKKRYIKIMSFFNIFQDFDKDSTDPEDEDNEDAPVKEVSELDREYDDAIFLKDEFIPNAFEFYLGIRERDDEEDYDEIQDKDGKYKVLQELEIIKPKNNKV